MSIEDTALERLMAQAHDDEHDHRPMSDAEHRRAFGWGWDDPDHADDDLRIIWGPPESV